MADLFKIVFGSANDRLIKRVTPLVERVNQLEPEYTALSDADLRGRAPFFRERLAKTILNRSAMKSAVRRSSARRSSPRSGTPVGARGRICTTRSKRKARR